MASFLLLHVFSKIRGWPNNPLASTYSTTFRFKLFGYHIHQNTFTEDTDLKIADVGTETRLVESIQYSNLRLTSSRNWLTDLSDQLSGSSHLDGLDISFYATPP